MDECNAALVLMSLSCSPHSPRAAWETQLGSSPGSSSASWSTGSSSPPLSDDGSAPTTNITRRGPRTTSLSTSDEGIVMDYNEDLPRKRRVSLSFCILSHQKYDAFLYKMNMISLIQPVYLHTYINLEYYSKINKQVKTFFYIS